MTAGAHTRRDDQRGQTHLVEIAATLLLLALAMTFIYSSIDTAERTIAGTKLRITNLDEARTLMAVLTKDIRTATRLDVGRSPFVTATEREMVFYANIDNAGSGGPRKVRIYVDGRDQIVTQVWSPDGSSSPPNYTYSGTPKNRYVGRYLANTAAEPIFEYFDDGGTELPAPVTGTDLLAVNAVRITLIIRAESHLPHGAITLVDQVRLPNVDYQTTQ